MDLPASPGSSVWQLEFARLFAYPVESPIAVQQQWWQDLAGRPDDFQLHETNQSRKVCGTFNGSRLSLTISPNLIVWEVQPVSNGGDLPTLGPFREKVGRIVELFAPWLENSCPAIRRLAFNGKLLQASATQKGAFQNLAAYLPGIKLEPIPNDFTLQINRRRGSTAIAGLPLNRVSTWSKMNAPFPFEPGRKFEWPEKCYSALELEINTAPEKVEVLPRERLRKLFQELAVLGVEIAESGDIP